jgi:hypothetical protein
MWTRLTVTVWFLALVGAGCGGNADSSSPPSTPPPTAATSSPTPSPLVAPKGCKPHGSSIEISTVNEKWVGAGTPAHYCLAVPADEPFMVTVHNDPHHRGFFSPNHNLSIYTDPSLTDQLFYGDLVYPGDSTTYDVSALAAGLYVFRCDIHPERMTGVLVVG